MFLTSSLLSWIDFTLSETSKKRCDSLGMLDDLVTTQNGKKKSIKKCLKLLKKA